MTFLERTIYTFVSILALASGTAASAGAVTYTGQVKTILDGHCLECHHRGGRSPILAAFPFTAGEDRTQEAIVDQIITEILPSSARMPPGARQKLSSAEIQTIKDWRAQGLRP